ncbi:MAG: hypothetical protein ACRD4D_09050, partial [Candidatus Acidiferrales bacterium]
MQPELQHKLSTSIAKLDIRSLQDVQKLFAEVRAQFDLECAEARNPTGLEDLRVRWRGRKGLDRNLRDNWLKPEFQFKAAVGKAYNELKTHIESALEEKIRLLETQEEEESGKAGALDLSLPGLAPRRGARHLVTQTIEEITGIFQRIGFSVVEGPEVETDYYNFEALNIPADHPARDTMDTFYVGVPARSAPAELLGGHGDQGQRLL